MLGVTAIVGGFAAAVGAICLAAPAGADALGYLSRLDNGHVSYMTQHDAINWGGAVCGSSRNGTDVPSVISMLQHGGGFSARDSGTVVGAATTEFCPDQYQQAIDWAHGQLGG